MQLLIFILGFVLFIGLIIAHEWGHFKAARRGGVEVEEFGLGLPPRAYGRKTKSGMLLSLNWLPLGGFVKLKGEHDSDKRKGSFGAAPLKTKIKIMLAGVTMNFILAIILFTILAFVGIPRAITKDSVGIDQFSIQSDTKIIRQEVRVLDISPGSPAEKAGLRLRDQIVSIQCLSCTEKQGTNNIKAREDLRPATKALAGQSVLLNIKRKNQFQTLGPLTLLNLEEVEASLKTNDPKGHLGVIPTELVIQRSTWSAPITAVGFTGQLSWLTLKGIGSALSGLWSTIVGLLTFNVPARQNGQAQATEQTGGIVAIMKILWESGNLGATFMLFIIAILSLSLAIINLLPIPALDGGRLFVTLIFRGLGKPLGRELEERIHGAGMVALITLFILITFVDVQRFY